MFDGEVAGINIFSFGSVDDAGDFCPEAGSGAHSARLEGAIKSAARKFEFFKKLTQFAKGDNFGVGGWVVQALCFVVAGGNNFSVLDDDAADFPATGFAVPFFSFFDGKAHKVFVGAWEGVHSAVRRLKNGKAC